MPTYSSSIKEAYEIARSVRANAHAPYSEFQVGAALKLRGQKELIGGCNVENASYGLTCCAERNALFQAVAKFGKIDPEYIIIVTDSNPPAPPCGLCLQAMAEFCQPSFEVYLANLKGIQEKLLLKDLLPKPFHLNFWSV
ncbi:MAG: cytidine deaminase [Opitutales bacterium]|nr:cytidine deaminase [Opitutales bacterium]